MQRIHFSVPGNPKAQRRHRDRKFGGKFDPSASDKADFLALCRDNAPERPIEGAVILQVVFWMPIPKSASKRFKFMVEAFDNSPWSIGDKIKLLSSGIIHIKRPDVDNLVKHLKDALTGVYWKDDSQVQIHCAYKLYSHRPRTEIEIIF